MKARTPLKRQVTLLFFCLGMLTLLITIFSMYAFAQTQRRRLNENLEIYTNQVLYAVEKGYEDIKNISASIAYNQTIQQFLLLGAGEEVDRLTAYRGVMSLLSNAKPLNNSIVDLAVIGANGNSANLTGDIDLYRELYPLSGSGQSIYYLDMEPLIIRDEMSICQIAAMPIYNMSGDNRLLGALFVAINPESIAGRAGPDVSSPLGELVLVNDKDQLIFGSQELHALLSGRDLQSGRFILGGAAYEVWQTPVRATGGSLYTVIHQSMLQKQLILSIFQQSFLIILVFLLAAVLFLWSSHNITRSLTQLTQLMNRISSGKRAALRERIPIDEAGLRCREVDEIAHAFNEMLDETNRLNQNILNTYERLFELEMTNRKTEIYYLRSQINPHFLYNTLTSICGLASTGDTKWVIAVAGALSKLYRYASKGRGMVPLREEINIIQSYVMIQQIRFEDRFTVEYCCPEALMDVIIPGMLLQPLVENAISHGLEPSLRPGVLRIEVYEEGGNLCIRIADTGVGMDKARLDAVRRRLHEATVGRPESRMGSWSDSPDDSGRGVGLCNVAGRIFLTYGPEYTLRIDSAPDAGTRVDLRLPCIRHPDALSSDSVKESAI